MKDNKIGTFTILLIFFCQFQGSQHLRLSGPQVSRGNADKVRLDCSADPGDSMDHGVHWFRQRKNEKNPEAIVYLSVVKRSSYQIDQNESSRFIADKPGNSFTLTINSFKDKDQGMYYCMVIKNSALTFSPGHQLLFPEVTAPKSTATTKPPPVTSAKEPEDDCSCNSGKKDPTDKETEIWKIDCNMNIWAPLAGLCGFLLICLLVTTIMLCCRTRRRRCRCKHRPLEEKNGQMNLMNKYKK
ncbi:T-cell surface glycoprotein CD8 alpha chain-like [Rana temporaria]|uniref:T-cell surface glycoprotein CD8 alpha chain-like n=1 Tax=Rana temporaria TaxID=8407 RepID=UPI001AAC9900|nr:T-cell surface glycoprotein CD8 alpha chain-like [Rana temporaria]